MFETQPDLIGPHNRARYDAWVTKHLSDGVVLNYSKKNKKRKKKPDQPVMHWASCQTIQFPEAETRGPMRCYVREEFERTGPKPEDINICRRCRGHGVD